MKKEMNEMFDELRGYLFAYAKSVCFYVENAEDITQEVLVDIFPKLDLTKEMGEIKAYARFKMGCFLKDKYRTIKSTGIQYNYECPTSFGNDASDEESDDNENMGLPKLTKEERKAVSKSYKAANVKMSVDFNERPDSFKSFEYAETCCRLADSFEGRVKEVFLAMVGYHSDRSNNTEIAQDLGITRQAVEQIIKEKIQPKIKNLLMLA